MPTSIATQRHANVKVPGPDRVVPPRPSTIDLHAHTARSDGLLDPADLVTAAAAAGVRLFSITDHDTVAGVRELLAAGGSRLAPRLELIPGVEINAVAGPLATTEIGGASSASSASPVEPGAEEEVHVIGLGVDLDDEAFEAALATQREQRRVRFERIVERLRQLGMPLDDYLVADDSPDQALGRPTAARALVAAGHAVSVEDAFVRWLNRGAPAFVPRTGLGPIGAIRVIRGAGGLPILAHYWEAARRVGVIRELIDVGLGGIETHHWSFDRPTVESVSAVARELHLVPSGGTDYHGDLGSYAEVHAGLWVPPEVGVRVRDALSS